MKIICSKAELSSAISIVSKAVATRTTVTIMECILITAENGEIRLTANNNELGIETIIDGHILEEGMIALDAKIISEIIRKLPDNDVTIQVDPNLKTTILCEKAKFEITGRSGDDFTYLPVINMDDCIEISQLALHEAIRQTIFSVADNDNNIVMTGELFEVNDNELKIVSLDGHRISVRKLVLNDSYGQKKVIVPGKTLQELNKILSAEQDEIVQIFFSQNHLMFQFDETTVVTRLIEGNYFDVNKMISSEYETRVKVNKKELLSCIDRATLLSKEGDKKPVVMNFVDGSLQIAMKSYIGSMDEDIDIEKDGKNLQIGFNPNFFIDALRVIDDEEVTLYMINQKYPCVIKDEQESYIYLILPVNFITV
jgi:DNA polymerase III subunit beta